MIIFAIIMCVVAYGIGGTLIGCICSVVVDEHPFFFGKIFEAQPETNQVILLITFWPIFLIYIIVWAVVWYVKHLYFSVRDFFKSFIKIEK